VGFPGYPPRRAAELVHSQGHRRKNRIVGHAEVDKKDKVWRAVDIDRQRFYGAQTDR
jgi:hypothetical protein